MPSFARASILPWSMVRVGLPTRRGFGLVETPLLKPSRAFIVYSLALNQRAARSGQGRPMSPRRIRAGLPSKEAVSPEKVGTGGFPLTSGLKVLSGATGLGLPLLFLRPIVFPFLLQPLHVGYAASRYLKASSLTLGDQESLARFNNILRPNQAAEAPSHLAKA